MSQIHYRTNIISQDQQLGISILVEPVDVTARLGAYVNISAVIRATKPSYQWYNQEGIFIANKCKSNLFIGPITQKDFGFYRLSILDLITSQRVLTRWVEVKNANSAIRYNKKQSIEQYTNNKTTPKLIVQPQGGYFRKGESINLTAHIENARYYQWYKDGTRLDGCTGNTLIITNAVLANTGTYILLASNEYKSTVQTQVRVIIN